MTTYATTYCIDPLTYACEQEDKTMNATYIIAFEDGSFLLEESNEIKPTTRRFLSPDYARDAMRRRNDFLVRYGYAPDNRPYRVVEYS